MTEITIELAPIIFLMVVIFLMVISSMLVWKFAFGASEQRNKTYIITTATIFTCDANNQTDCKVLASESVKKELKKLPTNEKILAI